LSHGSRIIGEHGFVFHPPLEQSDAFAVFYINRRYDKHKFLIVILLHYMVAYGGFHHEKHEVHEETIKPFVQFRLCGLRDLRGLILL